MERLLSGRNLPFKFSSHLVLLTDHSCTTDLQDREVTRSLPPLSGFHWLTVLPPSTLPSLSSPSSVTFPSRKVSRLIKLPSQDQLSSSLLSHPSSVSSVEPTSGPLSSLLSAFASVSIPSSDSSTSTSRWPRMPSQTSKRDSEEKFWFSSSPCSPGSGV